MHRVKSLLPVFLKNGYFQGINNLTRPCTKIRGGASQINQIQKKIPIQRKAKLLKWKTRPSVGKKVFLEEITNHQIADECLSIFNTNESMVKVQKSKLVQMLNWKEIPDWQLETYTSVVGMGFLWSLAAPSTEDREKNDGSPFTWKDYSSKFFNMICMRHPRVKLLILVYDAYELNVCIKDSEHDRRNTKKPTFVVRKTMSLE